MQTTEQNNCPGASPDYPSLAELERRYELSSDAQKASLRDSWDRQAEDWDKKYRREEEREDHEVRIRDAADWLRQRGVLTPTSSVADVGCGPGRFAAEFAKTASMVTGIDISPNMVRYGEEWCRELGLTNTRFLALDFANADVAAAGLEGKFDLAFSSITPAIATLHGLENLMRISRSWCFNASFVYRDIPMYDDILQTQFGMEPRPVKTNHSHWFYELFSLLWFRGYYPETHYYTQMKSVHLNADRETALRLTRFLLEEENTTEEAVGRVLNYLKDHADPSGCVMEDSECRYGWLLWDVRNRAETGRRPADHRF